MAINKVIYGGNTLIDLTDTSAVATDVLSGKFFYGRDGVKTAGTCTYNADTSDATAVAADILSGSTAYVNGNKINGAMVNNGAVTGTITTKAQQYTIPVGYHDGSGKVSISTTEQNKIIASNIKSGITILGVEGTYSGEAIAVEANKNVTPATTQQVVTPSTGYDYLAQVTVAAITYVESANTYGTTVSIAS
jgi:hypothetical protein